MFIEQVTRNVIASSTSHINKAMPSDLMSKVWDVGDSGLDMQFESFQRELCTSGYFEVW